MAIMRLLPAHTNSSLGSAQVRRTGKGPHLGIVSDRPVLREVAFGNLNSGTGGNSGHDAGRGTAGEREFQ
jgi:hypothetical protein